MGLTTTEGQRAEALVIQARLWPLSDEQKKELENLAKKASGQTLAKA